ncbi:hypothetical protein JQK87_24585 [Streptomyces sp. G44]|uniref:hypothetical protein n=1 Tax=Streptomyces sp. G44 TaxID=2807632 RepID=UPI001961A7EA|nr:hypothetical protein [Streptomyces sp. G44]MBM7171527.1 hypothetical protein [Streptomyces sp. G44]
MSDQLPPPSNAPYSPQPGQPTYPGPAQDPGHPYGQRGYAQGPHIPQRMPGVVRAAQIITWVLAGLTVLGAVLMVAVVNPETGGAALGVNLCLLVTAGMAFRFPTVGNGIRVTCIVLMSVQIALGLGGAANGNPVGLLPLLGAIAVVVLLSQGAAGAWFKRPRAHT